MYAAANNGHLAVVEALLAKGAAINQPDNVSDGSTLVGWWDT